MESGNDVASTMAMSTLALGRAGVSEVCGARPSGCVATKHAIGHQNTDGLPQVSVIAVPWV